MQTWFDYAAQHMFFIHRLQHLVLASHRPVPDRAQQSRRDLLWRGMPSGVRRGLDRIWIRKVMEVLQQPVLAAFLFVALIYLWPLPPIHYRAMLDPHLYTVMNWSVTIDGILFWALILDPRPQPLARISYAARFAYRWWWSCSRRSCWAPWSRSPRATSIPSTISAVWILAMSGLEDQTYAGLILWIPSSMMSVIGGILVLNFMRLADDAAETRVSIPTNRPTPPADAAYV